jgi:hypothetical protein
VECTDKCRKDVSVYVDVLWDGGRPSILGYSSISSMFRGAAQS